MTDTELLREALKALKGLREVVGNYGIKLPKEFRLAERATGEMHSSSWATKTAIAKLEERLLQE